MKPAPRAKRSTADPTSVAQSRVSDTHPTLRRAGPFVFFSGMGPRLADTADVINHSAAALDIRSQTRACIENVRGILGGAGGGLEHLVEITTYLVNMSDFGGYNQIYGEYFSNQGPARTTVAVRQLPHPSMLVEMKGIAYIAEDETANKRNENGVLRNG
jgi:2-aminomuconate deaminase